MLRRRPKAMLAHCAYNNFIYSLLIDFLHRIGRRDSGKMIFLNYSSGFLLTELGRYLL